MSIILAAGDIGAPDLVRFWTALAVLLLVARGLGLLAKRLGQPSVIGELSAGILLGPTLFARLAPDQAAWLFDGEVASIMLGTVAWLGVVMLLAITGFETDLGLLRRLGKAAAWTSVTSLVIPFAIGIGLAFALPTAFRGEQAGPAFILFMGVALAISALPVVAKVLREMGVIGRPVGQVTLAAGMVNDLIGWILLGLVAGLAGTGRIDAGALAFTITGLVLFLGLAITVGQRLVDQLLRAVTERDGSSATTVGMAMGVVLIAGAITQALGVEAVLGAFVAGILLSRSPLGGKRIEHQMAAVTDGFLAPIFFATAGLQVDLFAILTPEILPWAVAVVAVATFGKVLGGLIGARLGGMNTTEGLAIGVGLNARGALEIVVATIGLGLGVLSNVAYSVIVVMAVLTSMMAPPLLTVLGRRLDEVADDALQILGDARERSPILRARAALLPTRGGSSSVLAGQLMDRLLPAATRLTALTVHEKGSPADAGRTAAREISQKISRRLVWRDRTDTDPSGAILREARLGYDVIAVGATANGTTGVLSDALSQVLSGASVPVLIVQAPHGADSAALEDPTRIIAAVDGTFACDAARDVAASLAVAVGAELQLVHVLGAEPGSSPRDHLGGRRAVERAESVGRAAQERAGYLGANPVLALRSGADLPTTILQTAADVQADLIVVGTQIRTGQDLVLGRTVERLLAESTSTVLVVAFPSVGDHLAS